MVCVWYLDSFFTSAVFFTGDKKDEIEKPATSPNATSPIPPGINVRAGNTEDEEISKFMCARVLIASVNLMISELSD